MSQPARAWVSCLLLAVAAWTGSASAAELDWGSDVDAAWKTSVAEQRPIVLFVTRPNCRFCVEMKNKTFRDPEVSARIERSFVAVAVDAKDVDWLVKDMKITGYPTTLLISPKAEVVDRIKGFLPPSQFAPRLDRAIPGELATRENKKTS